MKILHISTQDKKGGGGSFDAAYRLHCNMLRAGMDSKMLVLSKTSDDSSVFNVAGHSTLSDKFKFYWFQLKRRYDIKRSDISAYFYVEPQNLVSASAILKSLPDCPDIIIAHWISGFIASQTLRDLNKIAGAPVLWYFMDMAPMTGGCHYMFDCEGYIRQCGNCPQLGSKNGEDDLSRRQWMRKYSSVQETNITAVVASSWQKKKLQSSSIFLGKRNALIPLGIDVDVFRPLEQVKARKLLGLPVARKIIFFGALNIQEERKGFMYLVKVLTLLHKMLEDNQSLREAILLVSAGKKRHAESLKLPFEHREIGFLKGDVALASAYQASDVFVCTSIEDAGPMMINEAILCGTPVVSFDMGVAMDLVHTGETGYRAKLKDAADMAVGLLEVLKMDDGACQVMRQNCRDIGLKLCHPDAQVQAFRSLCTELLNDNFGQKEIS